MTNEERIKSLSTEELADELYDITLCALCPISETLWLVEKLGNNGLKARWKNEISFNINTPEMV